MLAVLIAAQLAASPAPSYVKKRRHTVTKRSTSARENKELQIALLARRHAMLHDFLVEIGTEKPALVDPRVVTFANGIRVGPSSVDIDFLGSPLVRTRVTNLSSAPADILISVTFASETGGVAADVERLAPGQSRIVELMGAPYTKPASLRFNVVRL
jgi:hypothetical protein